MFYIYLLQTSIVVFFARQMGSFILRILFMTTLTFLFETQFRDAIQSGDHDSNNLSIERKGKLRDKL